MQAFLYDLGNRLANLQEALEMAENDKDCAEAIQTAVNDMGTDVQEVCCSGIGYIQSLKALAMGMMGEEKRLKDKRQAIEKKIARAMNGYMEFLQMVGETKVETKLGRMSIVKTGGKQAVNIYNADEIPEKYLTVIPAHTEPNKEAIRAALEAGEQVHGAVLEERKWRLNIS